MVTLGRHHNVTYKEKTESLWKPQDSRYGVLVLVGSKQHMSNRHGCCGLGV